MCNSRWELLRLVRLSAVKQERSSYGEAVASSRKSVGWCWILVDWRDLKVADKLGFRMRLDKSSWMMPVFSSGHAVQHLHATSIKALNCTSKQKPSSHSLINVV
jgi:hypothetical protein